MKTDYRLRRAHLLALLAFGLCLSPLAAHADDLPKRYLTLLYGFSTAPDEEASMGKTSGTAFAGTFGQRFQKNAAWELSAQQLSFGDVSTSTPGASPSDPAIVESYSQTKLLVTGGARYFVLRYLNIFAGLGYARVTLNHSTTASSASSAPPPRSGLALIYGGGLQAPLGRSGNFERTAEYEMASLVVSFTQINIGARLRF